MPFWMYSHCKNYQHCGSIRGQIKLLSHAMPLSRRMHALGRFHAFLSLGWQSCQMPVLKDEAIYRCLHNTVKQRNKNENIPWPFIVCWITSVCAFKCTLYPAPGPGEIALHISFRASSPSGFWLSSVNGGHQQRLGDDSA